MRRKLRKNTSKLRKSSKTFKEDYTQIPKTPAKKPKKGNVAKHKKKRSLQKKLKKKLKI